VRYEALLKKESSARMERDKLKARVRLLEEVAASDRANSDKEKKQDELHVANKTVAEAVFPGDEALTNPFLEVHFDVSRVDAFHTRKAIYDGHTNVVSAVAFHPKKPLFVTAGDDETWKLWTVPGYVACTAVWCGVV